MDHSDEVFATDPTNPYTWESRDYFVRSATSGTLVHQGKPCYQGINRTTGVVEFEGLQLAAVIINVWILQKALDDVRSGEAFAQKPPWGTIEAAPGGFTFN